MTHERPGMGALKGILSKTKGRPIMVSG